MILAYVKLMKTWRERYGHVENALEALYEGKFDHTELQSAKRRMKHWQRCFRVKGIGVYRRIERVACKMALNWYPTAAFYHFFCFLLFEQFLAPNSPTFAENVIEWCYRWEKVIGIGNSIDIYHLALPVLPDYEFLLIFRTLRTLRLIAEVYHSYQLYLSNLTL